MIARLDRLILRAAAQKQRLMGLALLRVLLGIAALDFYFSDYWDRNFLWGNTGYLSAEDAHRALPHGAWTPYLLSNSHTWLDLLFNAGIVIAFLFMVFGGRTLTLLHCIMMWSIYLRNQDLLEGGDNIARILLIFMMFTTNDAYLRPRFRVLPSRVREFAAGLSGRLGRVPTLLHNVACFAMLFQIAVLYFQAGYLKASSSMWNNGTAMYYVSHIHQFSMFSAYRGAMSNVWIGWLVDYFTIVMELALPFVIWSRHALVRKMTTVSLEGMHLGIILGMGLVPFGTIMIGADSLVLTDSDYRKIREVATTVLSRGAALVRSQPAPKPRTAVVMERREVH